MDQSENIFEPSEISQNLEGNQISRTNYVISSDTKYEAILAKLGELNDLLVNLSGRVQTIEENQATILANQAILSQGQAAIVCNEEKVAAVLERNEANNITNSEFKAQSLLLMETKIAVKKVEASVCRMTGETTDPLLDEVATMLPLKTLQDVEEVEQRLRSEQFASAMKMYLLKSKGISEDISSVIRNLFTDELLEKYNWEGRWEKLELGKLVLWDKILRDVFPQQGSGEFEKNVRKAIEKSHHRSKQKAYTKKQVKKIRNTLP